PRLRPHGPRDPPGPRASARHRRSRPGRLRRRLRADPRAARAWRVRRLDRHDRRNRATDYLRQTRDPEQLPDELPGGQPIEAESLAVLDVVRKLPEAYRETLLMRLVEGMSGAEIAERPRADAGVGAREPASRHEAAARSSRCVMSDYLWDPTEPPDPEVQRLEHLLGRLRTTAAPPRITVGLNPDTTEVNTDAPRRIAAVVSGFSRTDGSRRY